MMKYIKYLIHCLHQPNRLIMHKIMNNLKVFCVDRRMAKTEYVRLSNVYIEMYLLYIRSRVYNLQATIINYKRYRHFFHSIAFTSRTYSCKCL